MPDTHCRLGLAMTAALFSLTVTAAGCDSADESTDDDLRDAAPERAAPTPTVQAEPVAVPKIGSEFEQILIDQAGPAAWKCKLDTFQFRLANDTIASTTPPGGFFTPFPHGISTFDDPKLEDAYLFVVTMRDINNNVVGFASEHELVDLVNNKAQTSYTITLPGRGTLMMTERESFEVLIDAVNDMVADGELVRTFSPPLVEVLTIPGTGKVVGGSGEFKYATGVMQEIGVIHKIDLINNEFDLGVIVQALHC